MAYSPIFHGCSRTTMSMRPCALQLCRAYRASAVLPSASAVALRTQATLRLVHLPTPLELRMVACRTRGNVCLAVEVDWRQRSGVASPFLLGRSSSYGQFALQDVSSDESDLEFGPHQQQQQKMRKMGMTFRQIPGKNVPIPGEDIDTHAVVARRKFEPVSEPEGLTEMEAASFSTQHRGRAHPLDIDPFPRLS